MVDWPPTYFITWTTYGTWLPGDERGWVAKGKPGIQFPNGQLQDVAARRLAFDPVYLDPVQRQIVEAAIEEEAIFRGGRLHARNARTNHVHLVVTIDEEGEKTRDRFKAWCSRKLNETYGKHPIWWTRGGKVVKAGDDAHFENVVRYTVDGQ